ncbi:MAG TPA: hypothetical protein VGL80_10775 [Pseudonocardiaceae bacterium]
MDHGRILFHDLSFVDEGDEVLVGRQDTGTYAVLPADGAALLARLADGASPIAAANWYETAYGEPVDLDEFLETLAELGFLREETAGGTEPAVGVDRSVTVWTRIARAVFSPPALALFGAVVVWWLVQLGAHHDLLPRPGQVFFVRSLVIVQLAITAFQVPLIFLHEGSHVLAGRRIGLRATLGISNRLTNIVFESRMNSVLSVPRRQRYLPFLSGMMCDVVVWAVLDLIAQYTRAPNGSFSLLGRLALMLAFTTALRLAWQFQLYLRTDLYYVAATLLNCHDLHDASVALLRNRISRWFGRIDRVVDEEQWSERDRKVGLWYGPVIAFGILVFLVIAAWSSVPILIRYVEIVATRLTSGRIDAYFWDVLISFALNIANIVVVIYLARRKRRPAVGNRIPATD